MILWSPKQREMILHEQVRGFAEAGWLPGAKAETHGVRWHWYRDGQDYVIAGVVIAEHRPDLLNVAPPDILERFSLEDVERICESEGAGGGTQSNPEKT